MSTAAVTASEHLIDPEIADFLKLWPIRDLSPTSLAAARALLQEIVTAQFDAMGADRADSDMTREERVIPGGKGQPDVRAVIHRPVGDAITPGYFHVHGGGYVMGAPEFTDSRDRAVVTRHGCTVISPAYRLAPETKFPGAVEDCYLALKWFHENARALGVDPDCIIVGGESAGGGLAAALTVLVRDRGEIPIAGQLLAYPMLDDRTGSTVQPGRFSGEFLWTAAENRFGWASLLPCPPGSDNVSPYAAAARTTDMAGLPPTYILTGALDLFLDENMDFIRRLIHAGVPAGLTVYPGAYHAFDLAGETRLGRAFAADYDEAMIWLLTRPKTAS
ncbi:alpha/beta hydrolase [Novosphingobium colocasiae]|uniref:alpha/beta hydrolase n=1 Tax=Novosphingobium colocasiae TaxID=1256513 RepID=UPI0035B3A490